MLSYSVRTILAYIADVDNAARDAELAVRSLVPVPAEGMNTEERVILKAFLAIQQELEGARDAAQRLSLDHGQADLVWKA